jgi:hypothetical protein
MPAGPQPRALQGDPMSFTIAVGATTDEFVPFFRRSRKRVRCVRHTRYTQRATGFVLVFARDSEGERRDPFVPVVSSELKRSGWNPKDLVGVDGQVPGFVSDVTVLDWT